MIRLAPISIIGGIGFPQPGDPVFVTCLPLEVVNHWQAAAGDRLAKRASKGIKLLRDSSWGIKLRFVLLSLVPGRPLDLTPAHGVFEGMNSLIRRPCALAR